MSNPDMSNYTDLFSQNIPTFQNGQLPMKSISSQDNLSWNSYVQVMLLNAQALDMPPKSEIPASKLQTSDFGYIKQEETSYLKSYQSDVRFQPMQPQVQPPPLFSVDIFEPAEQYVPPETQNFSYKSARVAHNVTPPPVSVLAEPVPACKCKGNPNRIRRPRNAFILFRQNYHHFLGSRLKNLTNVEISKEIGSLWRTLSPRERGYWKKLADIEKYNHSIQYPNYKYEPRRSGKKGKCDACLKLAEGSVTSPTTVQAPKQETPQLTGSTFAGTSLDSELPMMGTFGLF